MASYKLPFILKSVLSLKRRSFLCTRSNAFFHVYEAGHGRKILLSLFLITVDRQYTWSTQFLSGLKPFCSSTIKLLLSQYVERRLFNKVEYNL